MKKYENSCFLPGILLHKIAEVKKSRTSPVVKLIKVLYRFITMTNVEVLT